MAHGINAADQHNMVAKFDTLVNMAVKLRQCTPQKRRAMRAFVKFIMLQNMAARARHAVRQGKLVCCQNIKAKPVGLCHIVKKLRVIGQTPRQKRRL